MEKGAKDLLRFILLVVILGTLFYVFTLTEFGNSLKTVEGRSAANTKVMGLVESFGVFGPIMYMLLYALLTMVLFPGVILTFVGAVLFGTIMGTAYTVIGATIGAVGGFFVAKLLGRSFVEQIIKGNVKKWDKKLERNGFKTMLLLRLIPLVPFNVLNFAPGLTRIKFKASFIT